MAARSQQSAIPTSEWQQIIVTSVAPEVGLEGVYTDLVKWERITLDHLLMTDSGEKIFSAWISESTDAHINAEGILFYGYQWWLGQSIA
jgi:hypothetical protein